MEEEKFDKSKKDKDFKKKNPKEKEDRQEDKDFKGRRPSKFNDISWYALNPELLKNAANIAFGNPAGTKLIGTTTVIKDAKTTMTKDQLDTVAGIAVQLMFPAIGDCSPDRNVPDIAAKSLYSWVRHQNSGHANYESSDMMCYFLAMREIYSILGFLIRLYGSVNLYDATNRYLPKALIEANGVDAEDLRNNRADFLFFINSMIEKVNSLCVPKDLPLFSKAFWIYSQVYAEEKYGKSQLYMYVPACFKKYTATKVSTGSALVTAWYNKYYFKDSTLNSINNQGESIRLVTFYELQSVVNQMLDELLADEDIGIISGDVLKAFKRENLFLLSPLNADFILTPIRDSFVVQQMHNTTPVNIDQKVTTNIDDPRPGDIVQGDNVIMQVIPIRDQSTPKLYNYGLVDIDSEVPTPEEVVEATQHTVIVGEVNATLAHNYFDTVLGWGNSRYVVKYNSDYICCGFVVISGLNGLSAKWNTHRFDILDYLPLEECPFTFTPVAKKIEVGSAEPYTIISVQVVNVKFNYTIASDNVIANMHYASVLSLFAIPAVKHLPSARF